MCHNIAPQHQLYRWTHHDFNSWKRQIFAFRINQPWLIQQLKALNRIIFLTKSKTQCTWHDILLHYRLWLGHSTVFIIYFRMHLPHAHSRHSRMQFIFTIWRQRTHTYSENLILMNFTHINASFECNYFRRNLRRIFANEPISPRNRIVLIDCTFNAPLLMGSTIWNLLRSEAASYKCMCDRRWLSSDFWSHCARCTVLLCVAFVLNSQLRCSLAEVHINSFFSMS